MSLRIDLIYPIRSRLAPSHKHDAARALLGDQRNHLLREALPAALGVGVGLVRAHRQARVEHEDAALGPRREEPAAVGRGDEIGVVLLQRDVHVLEGRRRLGRGPHREREAVRLVEVVVGVLA